MKTKRLTKFGAVLSAALVLLSGILSVSAASVPQAVIDTGRKASVSLYKYDFTSAHTDGVLGDNTYISTGYADENVENALMPYAIEGVVFSYAKIADLAVHAETKDGEHQNMLLYIQSLHPVCHLFQDIQCVPQDSARFLYPMLVLVEHLSKLQEKYNAPA